MRTVYSISCALLACVAALASSSVVLPDGGTIAAKTVASKTVFTITGVKRPIPVTRDGSVLPNAPVEKLSLVAQTKGAIILRDAYRSKSGSMSYCQAGMEEWLRIIATGTASRETLHVKLSSCRENIELADPGVKWDSAQRLLTLDWLTPGEGRSKTLKYRINSAGTTTSIQ